MRWLATVLCVAFVGCSSSTFDIGTAGDGAPDALNDSGAVADTDLQEEDTGDLPDTSLGEDTGTRPDSSTPDTGLKDTGTKPDSALVDSGMKDTATPPDTKPIDTGTFDSGAFDSGAFDSGTFDSGAFDSGTFDSGTFDSGGMVEDTFVDKCVDVVCIGTKTCCPSTGMCYDPICLGCCMSVVPGFK